MILYPLLIRGVLVIIINKNQRLLRPQIINFFLAHVTDLIRNSIYFDGDIKSSIIFITKLSPDHLAREKETEGEYDHPSFVYEIIYPDKSNLRSLLS